ncbi:nitrite reductase NiiA [Pseudozyma hubeiensis SY62]|uniref:Nitrite reductase NiiA n=1 Tax=Pseudozyma hubeiensis (strain SY62) TaxID=1305764 RepID=R9P5P9_PSEHS|nr:nitrite reductase NiiA [Pseudozyma hubeiensis SY62]GAC96567.1 nitrite reductase NiiA [Pseudozyma hubeiensis SY62]
MFFFLTTISVNSTAGGGFVINAGLSVYVPSWELLCAAWEMRSIVSYPGRLQQDVRSNDIVTNRATLGKIEAISISSDVPKDREWNAKHSCTDWPRRTDLSPVDTTLLVSAKSPDRPS